MIAAQRDLVILDPRAVEPENSDMSDVVVTAGVDAPRYLDLEISDVAFTLQVVEAAGDLLGDGDGARGGEGAVIHAGAGDDVGNPADVGGCKALRLQPGVDFRQVGLVDMRQDDILFMADAHFVIAEDS